MKKVTKISLWVVGTVAALLLIVGIGGGIYMVNFALNTKQVKSYEYAYKVLSERTPWAIDWFTKIHEENILKDTSMVENGYKLHAVYIPAAEPTDKTVLLCHGFTDNYIVISNLAFLFNHDLGYNVFIPEQYGHGQSEGDHIRMGWLDRLTYLKWIEMANDIFKPQDGDTQMVIAGVSMGGATTMMISGEKTPDYVKAFIDDCGYTSVWDEFAGELKNQFGLPTFPILNGASLVCRIKYGWGFKEASALKQVAKCTKPMLFIHGEADHFVPTWMVYPLYEAKSEPKQIFVNSSKGHARSYDDCREEYTEIVKAFLGQYIK